MDGKNGSRGASTAGPSFAPAELAVVHIKKCSLLVLRLHTGLLRLVDAAIMGADLLS